MAAGLPDVVGMPLADGAAALQELGLCVLVAQGSGDELQRIVVEQHPTPGSAVAEGSVVTIVIDTPENTSADIGVIGNANEAMGCAEGSGVGGVKGTGY